MTRWTVVVPVKGGPLAKSRLSRDDRLELAEAVALDTVSAAAGTGEHVVVVSSAPWSFGDAEVLPDPGSGLMDAVATGIRARLGPVAVLLGDHPGLLPVELAEALAAAARHPLAFVADAEGTGTALATALDARDHRLAFGPGSAARHSDAGYVALDGDWPGLRRDVDLLEHFDDLPVLGPLTAAFLAR